MAGRKKSWVEKLHDQKDLPRIDPIPPRWRKRLGEGLFVIPAPVEVYEIMGRVPRGKVITIAEIRRALAEKHGVKTACPLTTGIFVWISANASEELQQMGKTDTIPWWRTLKTGGELNPKFPGGIERQKQLLEEEGHRIISRGKRYFVENYETKIFVPVSSAN